MMWRIYLYLCPNFGGPPSTRAPGIVQSFVPIGVISVIWVVIGFSLTFRADHWHIIRGVDHVMLSGIGADSQSAWPRTNLKVDASREKPKS